MTNRPDKSVHRLPKSEIIRKQDDFSTLFRKGCHWKGVALHFYYRPSDERRVGFAVPKRLGNAVIRNRYKRWVRESYRLRSHRMKSVEMIILIKEWARDVDHHQLNLDVEAFVEANHLWLEVE